MTRSFHDIWFGVVQYIPQILGAIIVFLVGWVLGSFMYHIVARIVSMLRIQALLRKAGVEEAFSRAGFELRIAAFFGACVKWFIIALFLMTSLSLLGLNQVVFFLEEVVLLYIPQVVVAVLVLLLAAVIAEFAKDVVVGSAKAVGAHSANLAGSVTKWFIWILAILTALSHLGIAGPFVQTLFTGIVIALSLGFGLAFGLGGQEAAARYIEKVRNEISHEK